MCRRISIAAAAFATTLMMTVGAVQAFEGAKYPDWAGGGVRYRGKRTRNARANYVC